MAELDPTATSEMTFDVAEPDDGTVRVSIAGELDITNVDGLATAVGHALERGSSRLIVDVSALRFADSSAIAVWVQWATAVPEIELRGASPFLRKVVESMGLTETLNLTP